MRPRTQSANNLVPRLNPERRQLYVIARAAPDKEAGRRMPFARRAAEQDVEGDEWNKQFTIINLESLHLINRQTDNAFQRDAAERRDASNSVAFANGRLEEARNLLILPRMRRDQDRLNQNIARRCRAFIVQDDIELDGHFLIIDQQTIRLKLDGQSRTQRP